MNLARQALPRAGPRRQAHLLHVENLLTDGDWAVVELRLHARAMNGIRFDNRCCWVMRFANEVIVEVRAYLDSALVQELIDENEG